MIDDVRGFVFICFDDYLIHLLFLLFFPHTPGGNTAFLGLFAGITGLIPALAAFAFGFSVVAGYTLVGGVQAVSRVSRVHFKC